MTSMYVAAISSFAKITPVQTCSMYLSFFSSSGPDLRPKREKTRQQVTLDVLMNLDANILCLQELDNYDNFYKEKLWQHDYSSIYVKRGGMKKRRIFEFDIEDKIDYNDLAELILDESTHVKLKEKALDSDTNGQGKNSQDHGDPDDPFYHEMIEDDLKHLKRVFSTYREGLITEGVVEKETEGWCEGVLDEWKAQQYRVRLDSESRSITSRPDHLECRGICAIFTALGMNRVMSMDICRVFFISDCA
ncbi:DNAse I-like superfamily protein [Tanacetum coccineum]